MFWPLTSRKEVKMTPNQKPPLGFGFSTPENPRIRIFSKCIRKLAPQFKKGFFQKYALTIISLLFLTRLRPSIYQNDGLDEYFSEKNCFRSWRHGWRHKRHLWRHIGFKTWKRHNFVVFQSIWTIDTPKSRYWNELSKKLKKNNATTIGTPYMTS